MTVDSKTLALSIAARAKHIQEGATLFSRDKTSALINQDDVFHSLDMIKQRMDDEWRIFVRTYEAETKRIRECADPPSSSSGFSR